MFGVLLAAILSFYYISRYQTLSDKFSLFLGIGFLANSLIDLLHVIISYNLVNEPLFLKYFIPQTWFAGICSIFGSSCLSSCWYCNKLSFHIFSGCSAG